MRWAMTTKRGRWPQTATYHPDDPFALWRDSDGQRYLLDRFFTKLLQLNKVMMTQTGRAMAERRIAFLAFTCRNSSMSWQREDMGMTCQKRSRIACSGTRREQESSSMNSQLKNCNRGELLLSIISTRSST